MENVFQRILSLQFEEIILKKMTIARNIFTRRYEKNHIDEIKLNPEGSLPKNILPMNLNRIR